MLFGLPVEVQGLIITYLGCQREGGGSVSAASDNDDTMKYFLAPLWVVDRDQPAVAVLGNVAICVVVVTLHGLLVVVVRMCATTSGASLSASARVLFPGVSMAVCHALVVGTVYFTAIVISSGPSTAIEFASIVLGFMCVTIITITTASVGPLLKMQVGCSFSSTTTTTQSLWARVFLPGGRIVPESARRSLVGLATGIRADQDPRRRGVMVWYPLAPSVWITLFYALPLGLSSYHGNCHVALIVACVGAFMMAIVYVAIAPLRSWLQNALSAVCSLLLCTATVTKVLMMKDGGGGGATTSQEENARLGLSYALMCVAILRSVHSAVLEARDFGITVCGGGVHDDNNDDGVGVTQQQQQTDPQELQDSEVMMACAASPISTAHRTNAPYRRPSTARSSYIDPTNSRRPSSSLPASTLSIASLQNSLHSALYQQQHQQLVGGGAAFPGPPPLDVDAFDGIDEIGSDGVIFLANTPNTNDADITSATTSVCSLILGATPLDGGGPLVFTPFGMSPVVRTSGAFAFFGPTSSGMDGASLYFTRTPSHTPSVSATPTQL